MLLLWLQMLFVTRALHKMQEVSACKDAGV
jgi:hypothetical protein